MKAKKVKAIWTLEDIYGPVNVRERNEWERWMASLPTPNARLQAILNK